MLMLVQYLIAPYLISLLAPFRVHLCEWRQQHNFAHDALLGWQNETIVDEETTGESGPDQHGHHGGGARRGRRGGRRPGAGGVATSGRADHADRRGGGRGGYICTCTPDSAWAWSFFIHHPLALRGVCDGRKKSRNTLHVHVCRSHLTRDVTPSALESPHHCTSYMLRM